MMTTNELVTWVKNAIDLHEKEWAEAQLHKAHQFRQQMLEDTQPMDATSIDQFLAGILIHNCWNEAQFLYESFIDKTNNENNDE